MINDMIVTGETLRKEAVSLFFYTKKHFMQMENIISLFSVGSGGILPYGKVK